MSFYPYYQSYQPGHWGTQQYMLPGAPRVSYMPQVGWGAQDFYHAHSGWHGLDSDPDFLGRIIRHVRTSWAGGGFSNYEAQRLHSLIYSGMMDVRSASPEEIGAAAAYEAMRYWETNVSQWQMPSDYGMEEDSLMALAVAEARKLWTYAGRLSHDYQSRYACENAAATVHRIFRHGHRGILRRYGDGYRHRHSFSGWGSQRYLDGGYGSYGGYGAGYGGYAGGYGQGYSQPGGYLGYGGYGGGAYGSVLNGTRLLTY